MSQKNLNTFACSHSIQVGNEIFPCGKCINCRKNRINEWANRMLCEFSTQNNKGIFVTLTYNEKYLPADTTLKKKDLQDFLKRFRRRVSFYNGYYGTFKVKYFAAGEYGKEIYTFRPHFHIIFFGLEATDKVIEDLKFCWARFKKFRIDDGVYKRNVGKHKKGDIKYKKYVDRDSFGFVDIETLDYQRHFHYVAKYSVKTMNRSKNGVPEFVCMSLRKAIGLDYLEKNKDKILENQGVIKISKREFRFPALFKRKFKEEVKAHTKVIYNIVTLKPMKLEDAFLFIYNCIAKKEKNKVEKTELNEFLCKTHDYNFITPKQLLDIHDRNEQKEKSYMFRRKKSYVKFYKDNERYFRKERFVKVSVVYNDKQVVQTNIKYKKIDFIDFLKYYNNNNRRLLYYKTYEYF